MIYRALLRSAAILPRTNVARVFHAQARAPSRNLRLLGALAVTTLGITSYVAIENDNKVNLADVRKDIEAIIDTESARRGDGSGIGPEFVRLAWHASGTYSKHDGSGGSNGGLMRYNPEANWGANSGLHVARLFLEPIKAKYPGLSYADLYTFAGVVAIESMGGPTIPWKPGRVDYTDGKKSPPNDRLPGADLGSKEATIAHIRQVFNRMGFNDREIVALIGAHSIGRCHEDRSGYVGPWTNAETTFSNEFFRLLLEEKWTLKSKHNGVDWTGPAQYEDSTKRLMMLPADLALTWDPQFLEITKEFAKNEEVFFREFSGAFGKLLALGVPAEPAAAKPQASSGGVWGSIKGLLKSVGINL